MISFGLDSNNDIILESGSFKRVSNAEQVVQHVRSRLLFYFGEWFLDRSAGVPYFEQVFVKPLDLARVESVMKTTILQTPGVLRLIEFSMDYEGANSRKLQINFTAETEYGVIDKNGVTINV